MVCISLLKEEAIAGTTTFSIRVTISYIPGSGKELFAIVLVFREYTITSSLLL